MIELKAEKVCPKCNSSDRCAAIALKDGDEVIRCVYFGQLKKLLKEINDDMYEAFKRCANENL